MTLLALVRHGDTAWSAEGRIQGRTDIPLSERGRAKIRDRALPPDWQGLRVFSSPLARCVETASLLDVPAAKVDDRLIEMHWGTWEGRTLADLRAELGSAFEANEARGLDFMPVGGESPRQVLARVRGLLADIASDGRPALAVAHRGVIRVTLALATGWDMLGKPPHKLDWGALHIFRLDAAGTPSVHELNVPLVRRLTEVRT